MTAATDRTVFELRLTTPRGGTMQVGPIATPAEARALARSYLGDGRAIRVALFGRRRGCLVLYGVLGQAQQPPDPTTDAASDGA